MNTYYLTQLHHNETMFALSLNCVLFQIILRALASFIVAIFCSSDCFITFVSRISLETTMKIKLRALGLITTKSFYSFSSFIPLFFRNGGNQLFTRSFLSALAVLTVWTSLQNHLLGIASKSRGRGCWTNRYWKCFFLIIYAYIHISKDKSLCRVTRGQCLQIRWPCVNITQFVWIEIFSNQQKYGNLSHVYT